MKKKINLSKNKVYKIASRIMHIDLVTSILYLVIFVIAVFIGVQAVQKRRKSVLFGDLRGIHIILPFVLPWVEIIAGMWELGSSDED